MSKSSGSESHEVKKNEGKSGSESHEVKKNEGKDGKTEIEDINTDSGNESDSSGLVILKTVAVLTISKDPKGNWGVVQQTWPPASSTTTRR